MLADMHRKNPGRLASCLAFLGLSACSGAPGDYGDTGIGEGEGSWTGAEGSATAPATTTADPSGGSGGADEDSADGGSGGAEEAGSGGAEEGDSEGEPTEPGQLTAGEWRDLDHWDFWLNLLMNDAWSGMQERWGFFTEQRFAVVVTAGEDGPHVADAEVVLLDGGQPLWTARTDVRGEADLFAGLFAMPPGGARTLEVTVGEVTTVVEDVQPAWQAPIVVAVDEAVEPPAQILDLMFMIDTTGSMDDELSYLQAELADVIDRVRQEVGQDTMFRVSVNFYRDDGDEYVVKPFAFTTDIDQALVDLNAQEAGGGGDLPEAVDKALDNAIDSHEWSASAVARLCFLVLDAPPHDDAQIVANVRASIKAAAAKGVRLIPLAASGTDKELEFLLRFGAIASGGTYTFLTDHSGIGNGHSEPTIGAYQIEHLNDMLVRLISEALLDG
jgi:hypothetical protein